MSTKLHGVLDSVFGILDFVIPFSLIIVKKCDYLQVVNLPYSKNRFLVNLRSFFHTYKIFQGGDGFSFLVY